jgi:hypothetical protein
MPEIKLIEAPQLLVDWNRLGGEDRKCDLLAWFASNSELL